jgi:hypothetical protein
MANIDFDDLEPLACPLVTQPDNNTCIGDLIKQYAYNLAILERALLKTVVAAGMLQYFMGGLSKIPKGYVIADGSWYSPETFPNLFANIKYIHGKREDGCFRVPDLRSTILVGLDMNRKCLTDVNEYVGLDVNGDPVEGDNVGASRTYCQSPNIGQECDSLVKKKLAIPLISTGEICL